METKEILDACVCMMGDHMQRGDTVSLFKAMYPWPLDDIGSIAENIQRVDQHTRASLLEKIDGALMDLREYPETQGEALMFRLRLENAIRMLTVLSQAKVPCVVKTTIAEEAMCWALTTLWTGSGAQWVYLTAEAFCAGRSSALPWPLPA